MAVNGLPDRFLDAGVPEVLLRAICGSEVTGTPDAGLAIGTVSTAKVKQVNAVDYMLLGVKKAQAAVQEFAFTANTHDISIAKAGTTNERWYTLYIDNAGAAQIVAGKEQLGTVGAKKNIKDVPFDAVVLGFVKISVAPTATAGFDATTTALSATGVTVTYLSVKKVIIDDTFEP
jgi:hypothetical protein